MKFIFGTSWKGSVLGLSRITELVRLMGDPQKKLKFVHIAGTNGKGSTAAMLASVLAEAGYKTGLFTSPYIESFNEMIAINGAAITDDALVSTAAQVQQAAAQMEDAPTEYEIITAIAFEHFLCESCDIVVLEVGMGGRLDSTNVIDVPEVAVITAIGLDHMAQLGPTVEKIAGEKAGIIKEGGTVVCHPQISSVEDVIRNRAAKMNASVMFAQDVSPIHANIDGQEFSYKAHENLKIPLLGDHQLRNAAVVIETVNQLRNAGWKISDAALAKGLHATNWPCRFEVLRKSPLFIADVSHNPQGISVTLDTLHKLSPTPPIFIFGVLADKDYKKMADLLIRHAKHFFLVTPENPRALPAQELESYIGGRASTTICESLNHAVTEALATNETICVLGSLSMLGDLRTVDTSASVHTLP